MNELRVKVAELNETTNLALCFMHPLLLDGLDFFVETRGFPPETV
jgi:hypothetical protein